MATPSIFPYLLKAAFGSFVADSTEVELVAEPDVELEPDVEVTVESDVDVDVEPDVIVEVS